MRVGDQYKDMISQAGSTREVRDYLREKIRGGRFFIKCLEQRQHTMLQIARQIVERQREFFDHGPAHLKPMTMSQVAQAVGVHETTVSRAVSGKYMASPRGVFEMKYFFTSGYTTAEGDSVSNESVRQAISEIIKTEDARKPLERPGYRRAPLRAWPSNCPAYCCEVSRATEHPPESSAEGVLSFNLSLSRMSRN